jgi:Fe/S biogenesis protein NfuA
VDPSVRESIPPVDVLRDRIQGILDREINPSVASHGGVVRLLEVKQNMVYVEMGGGCQGCGMADVTLKQGVEIAIRSEIPEVGEIMDTTDHASGNNPYYAPSKK